MKNYSNLNRDQITPQKALDILIQGNGRFINNIHHEKDMQQLRNKLKDKQYPFASVLGCSDSRVSSEIIFDQNLGDIFSVRLAGNVASTEAIGSLEFSTEHLGSKIIIVMGHTNCGAIKAACDNYHGGNITEIINLINPAVNAEKSVKDDNLRNSSNNKFVEKVCFLNVQYQIKYLLKQSQIIKNQVDKKKIGIIGAVYDLSSGEVIFDTERACI